MQRAAAAAVVVIASEGSMAPENHQWLFRNTALLTILKELCRLLEPPMNPKTVNTSVLTSFNKYSPACLQHSTTRHLAPRSAQRVYTYMHTEGPILFGQTNIYKKIAIVHSYTYPKRRVCSPFFMVPIQTSLYKLHVCMG